MQEEWKGLIYNGEDYSIFYEISNYGNIRNAKSKKEVKQTIGRTGYYQYCCSLGSRDKYKLLKIHRCVACTFLSGYSEDLIINHKDCNKLNNNVDNLEWCTHKENAKHAIDNNRIDFDRIAKLNHVIKDETIIKYILTNFKLNDRENGLSALARKFNVNRKTVASLINRNI